MIVNQLIVDLKFLNFQYNLYKINSQQNIPKRYKEFYTKYHHPFSVVILIDTVLYRAINLLTDKIKEKTLLLREY